MMSRELERRIAKAAEIAKQHKHEFVTLEHVLMALTESPETNEILEAVGCNVQNLKAQLQKTLKTTGTEISYEQIKQFGGFDSWQPEFSLACHRLFQRAALQVRNAGKNQITEGQILVALFYEQDSFAVFHLQSAGVSQFDIINYISHGMGTVEGTEPESNSKQQSVDADGLPADSSKKSALDTYCENLNEKFKAGRVDPLIGRQDILDRVMQILCRRTKNNPLLIGEPGVGKTAIAEGLAAKIETKEVPELLAGKVVYALDMGSLLAGTKFRGDFENRLKSVVKDVQKRQNVILFIDEIHTLVGAGATSGGSMDASNLLKPALANGEISCMGSTTHAEYRQHFEKDRALNRRFQKIDVKEPTPNEAKQILDGLKSKFENHHQVEFANDALQAAVDLSIKYLHGKLLPDKAIDLIDEAGSFARLHKMTGTIITAKEIEETVARITHVPAASVSASDKEQLRDMDKKLKAMIYGQEEAIEKVVASIKFARSGLGREGKPIGSYLFTGPTGVGKTEVTKQLSEVLGVPLVRFDMSEYMEKHTVSRLVGAPPGYVGFDEGGLLTEAIHKSPYCVLLLDEIEKAHPDVFNILLQVMDAGRLTDSNGRTSDFRNVILIMTSNAGAAEVAKGSIGIADQGTQSTSMEAIKKVFAPEFLNRLDAVVHFKALDESIVLKITQKFVDDLKMQLHKKNVDLQISSDALKWLMEKGYDKVYGARPMARTIDEHLKKSLVDELLFGRLAKGGKVQVYVKDHSLGFDFSEAVLKIPERV